MVLKKIPKLKTDMKKRSSALGGIQAVVISACDMLLTYTALFKDDAHKHEQRIERRIFYGTRPFLLNMTFHACDK